MQIRRDIFGREPLLGDTVVYNPPGYKGLQAAKVIGFSKAGLPIIVDTHEWDCYESLTGADKEKWNQTPKTGFAIIQSL